MQITSRFAKYHADILAPILLNIFNAILETGFVPHEWKTSFIVPIPKKGSVNDKANYYRSIALQSVVPKVFDKLLTNKLTQHLASIIPSQQHGFVSKKSTLTNLVTTTKSEKWTTVDALYFDFSTAFDQVDHETLAVKLAKLSLPNLLFVTTLNFITNRNYALRADGKLHQYPIDATSGVPQGSHCGPLLYLIMSHDIVDRVRGLDINLAQYAHDTKFFAVVDHQEQMQRMQEAIDPSLHGLSKTELH